MQVNRIQLRDSTLWRHQAFIAGRWLDANDGGVRDIRNPATGDVLGQVPYMGRDETRAAIAAADRAQPAWRALLAQDRANILRRWYALVQENLEDLAWIMTLEQGKPLSEARGELHYAASFIEWYAEEARRVYGEIIPAPVANRQQLVLREPVGVCAIITPWNFPAAMITRKAAPALAAGCTMIIKPASQTPFTALALVRLAELAGLPPGVLNVVIGQSEAIGVELTANPLVRKLSFTGSTEVGRELMRQGAGTVKKLSLELGGNAPFIVFEDADLDAAVDGALAAKYRNAGQACIAANRFFVHDSLFHEFTNRLAEKSAAMKVGPGWEPDTAIGPLIDAQATQRVTAVIADAVAQGAKILTGGVRLSGAGNFFAPTVLTEVMPSMRVFQEETFGPVLPIMRFQKEDEAIRLANETHYGLAAYFYSRDLARTWRIAEALEFGMVGINTGQISNATIPFGGIKQSGIGREGSHHGIDEYLQLKTLSIAGL